MFNWFKKRKYELEYSEDKLKGLCSIIEEDSIRRDKKIQIQIDDIELRMKTLTYKVARLKGDIPKESEIPEVEGGEKSPPSQNIKGSVFLSPDGKPIYNAG